MPIDTAPFRVPPAKAVDLGRWPTRVKPLYDDKADYQQQLGKHVARLAERQNLLYAHDRYALLLIFQAMDAAGKDGVIKHVMSGVNPQGCQVTSFKHPSAQELDHDFLWRTTQWLPERGRIGIFNRSYYEDVLVVRVHELVPRDVWEARYDEINAFEKELVDSGTTLVKCALFVSLDEQKRRLAERLDRPDKHWKYSPGDLKTRAKWDAYQEAYADVFRLTSTEHAPWYVLPADRKWYPRLAVTEILTRTLEEMNLDWPKATFDVEEQRAALAATMRR